MKIRKRREPMDFRGLAQDEYEPMIAAFKRDAATDAVLAPPEPPMVEPRIHPDRAPLERGQSERVVPISPLPFTAAAVNPPPALAAAAAAPNPSAWPIYLTALFASALWALAPIAFAYGYRQAKAPFDFDPFVIAVLGAMALGPACLVWVAAYLIHQSRLLGAEAVRARKVTDEMVAPALAAGQRAADVVRSVREEILRAGEAAEGACASLSVLRQAMAVESERVLEAAAGAHRTAQGLTEDLGRERAEMGAMAEALAQQALAVTTAIDHQVATVAQAHDLAVTQLREAEASLIGRASDLTAAGGQAVDAARATSEDLTRHITRLETVGAGVAEQVSGVEQALGEQRLGLSTVAQGLKSDHAAFSVTAENQAAHLSEILSQARLSVAEMGDRAVKGGETLRQMIAEAMEQFRELGDAARAERDELGQSTQHALDSLSRAAQAERQSLEIQTQSAIAAMTAAAETSRVAAARHAEAAGEQVDQLSEAAFTAGQKASAVFDSRLAEARALIEQSASLVEQAGDATARRLDQGAATARATLQELSGLLSEIEERAARLPAAAMGQAQQVRRAVTENLEELMDHARRTAEETQAIDAAFQDRVRRNYEMLSEAVLMMGSVANMPVPPTARGAVSSPQQAPPTAPPPQAYRPPPAPEPVRREPLVQSEPDPLDGLTLRPRLKLTPTATDEEFTQLFEQAGGKVAEPAEGWTWKDLLTSLDGVADDGVRNTAMSAEIAALRIDVMALLPEGRLLDIAQKIHAGEDDRARDLVRRLAPAATRRLTQRMFDDSKLRQEAVAYVARYQDLLATVIHESADGGQVLGLLSSEAGRTYLLVETAAAGLQ